jgi:hypothetical protein
VIDSSRALYSFTVALLQHFTYQSCLHIQCTCMIVWHDRPQDPVPAEVPAEATDSFTRRSIWLDHGRGVGISMDGLVRSAGNPSRRIHYCKYCTVRVRIRWIRWRFACCSDAVTFVYVALLLFFLGSNYLILVLYPLLTTSL